MQTCPELRIEGESPNNQSKQCDMCGEIGHLLDERMNCCVVHYTGAEGSGRHHQEGE